jgi:hypothetical protein
MKAKKTLAALALAVLAAAAVAAAASPALVVVENDSAWNMEVKVMTSLGSEYGRVSIAPWSKATVSIHRTGEYFMKSKATKPGSAPVYGKGNGFRAVSEGYGYSVITVTYSISGGGSDASASGTPITEAEYER